jgi:hypothetical protein
MGFIVLLANMERTNESTTEVFLNRDCNQNALNPRQLGKGRGAKKDDLKRICQLWKGHIVKRDSKGPAARLCIAILLEPGFHSRSEQAGVGVQYPQNEPTKEGP